jgi:preprotein translocase subunit SecB
MSDQNPEAPTPNIRILAQYIKDLSFENPQAPMIFQELKGQPDVGIGVNITAKRHNENLFEIDIRLKVEAKQDDKVTFMVELLYGGIFNLSHIPQELLEALIYIECPRLVFPYMRRIIGDVTRDGGFPPLLLDPIDFATLYQQQVANQQPV